MFMKIKLVRLKLTIYDIFGYEATLSKCVSYEFSLRFGQKGMETSKMKVTPRMSMKTKDRKNESCSEARMSMINNLVSFGDSQNVIENKGTDSRRNQFSSCFDCARCTILTGFGINVSRHDARMIRNQTIERFFAHDSL
jgi:hypothetical protein